MKTSLVIYSYSLGIFILKIHCSSVCYQFVFSTKYKIEMLAELGSETLLDSINSVQK